MTYKEWLTTEAGMRWEKAIKSFVPDHSDLKAVVHITQDVFHASKNAVEAEMRIDDRVAAAETARCNLVINDLKAVIKELVDVMEMQEGRENETLHIPQETALYIWRNALSLGKTALAREPVQLQPAQESDKRDNPIADCIVAAIEAYDKPPTWSEICCEIDQMGNNEHWDPTWIVRVMHQMKKDGRLTESLLLNSNGRSVWALTKPAQESAGESEAGLGDITVNMTSELQADIGRLMLYARVNYREHKDGVMCMDCHEVWLDARSLVHKTYCITKVAGRVMDALKLPR